ncbi:MAG: M48 family metallopeptidase, partial [Verrucomicrobiota bacterium]
MTGTAANSERAEVQFGSERIPFELVRGEGRQLRIDVHPDRRVVVHAPSGKPAEEVSERVRKRSRWILRQLDFFDQFQPLPTARRYVDGETHYYLGRQYRLRVEIGPKPEAKLIGRYLHVTVADSADTGRIADRVQLWYRQHARQIFAKRAAQCFEKLRNEGIPFPEIKLRRMPTRWGSYSRPGTILLNPELVKAPLYCIEYVIMHELCHLKHPNHSRAFHHLLTRCMPDW